jgi:hypothetical protein
MKTISGGGSMKFVLSLTLGLVIFATQSFAAPICISAQAENSSAAIKRQTQFTNELKKDAATELEARIAKKSADPSLPVRMTKAMAEFRDYYLSYFKNLNLREALIRSFEGALRMRSQQLAKSIAKAGGKAQYDVVIVGAGVHGIIALHEVMAINPNLKVLIVDQGDTGGAVFRYGQEAFYINSSSRASGPDSKPLPGEGNINELPGLAIQVSDLTALKYPTANDLGTALVTGLYAAVQKYPGVEVLFNSEAKQVLSSKSESALSERLEVQSTETNSKFRIDSQYTILASGLGVSKIPPKLLETLRKMPGLSKPSAKNKLPRVLSFEDLIRILGSSNDPMKFFKDKKIGIAGAGDSAYVLIEFLLGLAPREAYALSDAQTGRPVKIAWFNQKAEDCQSFIKDIRARYYQVSTGYRSSSPNFEALFSISPEKLVDVEAVGANKLQAVLENSKFDMDLDAVVVATGFEQNLRQLFNEISSGRSLAEKEDVSFFQKAFNFVKGRISTSPGQETPVGWKMKDQNVLVTGTAAGQLAPAKANVGIVQNFVSIFNNAPRVVSLIRQNLDGIETVASGLKPQFEGSNPETRSSSVIVAGIGEARVIANKTQAYLQAMAVEAYQYNGLTKPMRLQIELMKDDRILVRDLSGGDVTGLVQSLTSTRDFFALSKEILNVSDQPSLVMTLVPGKSAKLEIKTPQAPRKMDFAAVPVVQNASLKLRGFANMKAERESAALPENQSVIQNSEAGNRVERPRIIPDQSQELPKNRFFFGTEKRNFVSYSESQSKTYFLNLDVVDQTSVRVSNNFSSEMGLIKNVVPAGENIRNIEPIPSLEKSEEFKKSYYLETNDFQYYRLEIDVFNLTGRSEKVDRNEYFSLQKSNVDSFPQKGRSETGEAIFTNSFRLPQIEKEAGRIDLESNSANSEGSSFIYEIYGQGRNLTLRRAGSLGKAFPKIRFAVEIAGLKVVAKDAVRVTLTNGQTFDFDYSLGRFVREGRVNSVNAQVETETVYFSNTLVDIGTQKSRPVTLLY